MLAKTGKNKGKLLSVVLTILLVLLLLPVTAYADDAATVSEDVQQETLDVVAVAESVDVEAAVAESVDVEAASAEDASAEDASAENAPVATEDTPAAAEALQTLSGPDGSGMPLADSGVLPKGKVDVPYTGVAADFADAWAGDLYYVSGDWPEGFLLDADTNGFAILKGDPIKSGTYVITFQEMKSPPTVDQEWIYSLTIDPRDTITLPDGLIGNAYTADAAFTINSGITDVQLAAGTALPKGLTFSYVVTTGPEGQTITAEITGYPTKAGTYTFGLQAYEAAWPIGDPYTYSITIGEPDHYFQDGVNTYTRGSGLALVHITEKDLVTHNQTVYVVHAGDATVDPEDQITQITHYKHESGSTKITLNPTYLDTLTAGEHWLQVGFDDEGAPVMDVFYISVPQRQQSELPQTGDEGGLLVVSTLLFTAGLAILAARIWRKQQQ